MGGRRKGKPNEPAHHYRSVRRESSTSIHGTTLLVRHASDTLASGHTDVQIHLK